MLIFVYVYFYALIPRYMKISTVKTTGLQKLSSGLCVALDLELDLIICKDICVDVLDACDLNGYSD